MALAIDSTHLAESILPGTQYFLDDCTGHARRYQIYRVCAHATAIHGASTFLRMLDKRHPVQYLTNKEALDLQADEDDDLDEVEVMHHLKQQAATSPLLEEVLSLPNRGISSTTLVTSLAVQSPSAISSFRRYSFRVCMLDDIAFGSEWIFPSSLRQVIPHAGINYSLYRSVPKLSIVGASSRINTSPVLWHLQFDFVDLLSPRSRPPTKRRRTLNPFHRVPSAPPVHDSLQPEAKRFNGVRYRLERRTWAAEMKPSKYKNKVYVGEAHSQAQAARIVDAAFHYYDKPLFLNFPDTPQFLSSRVIPAGLDKKCKLEFVKEQAKWLASKTSALSPSSGGCTADTSRFGSFSEIASFLSLDGDGDEADDGISRPQTPSLPDVEAGLDGSVRIPDGWDGAEHCSTPPLANIGNSTLYSRHIHEWWTNLPPISSAPTMIPHVCKNWPCLASPRCLRRLVAYHDCTRVHELSMFDRMLSG